MAQVDARNLDSRIILGGDQDVRLRELLPQHWLAG
jgi:hypothetical protein